MKVRQGFVSNSSSSSYVIKVSNSKACPTCGRKTFNIIDYIKNNRQTFNDETYIRNESKESLLNSIKEDIEYEKKDIEKYSRLDKNKIPLEFRAFGSKTTAGEFVGSCEDNLKKLQDKHDYIKNIDGEVYRISIGYHDEYTQEIFNQGINDGSIKVFEELDGFDE